MKRVLVTGAAGFIGGRVVERLAGMEGVEVLAGVRSWKGCARVARLGVRLVRCDVLDPQAVGEAMIGASRVVHCAMSDGASIVEGTRNVLAAAAAAGVEKALCLSTGDVYSATDGEVDESGRRDRVGDWYADAKRDAEVLCEESIRRGMKVTWLRPGIVYGPFCYAWTQRIGLRLAARQVQRLRDAEDGVCNAVFVDDVVEACVALLDPGLADGEALNINGPAQVSWNQYLDAFAVSLGVATPGQVGSGRTGLRSSILEPARLAARAVLKHFQKPVMALYASNRLANRVMKRFETMLKGTPERREMRVYSRRTHFADSRLRTLLPKVPCTSLEEGLRISSQYLRVMGLID